MNIRNRFKDAPWMTLSPSIHILGAGGIGSNTIYNLTKTIPGEYYLQDYDLVENHNIGTQFFGKSDLGLYKVEALQKKIRDYSELTITALTSKFLEHGNVLPICITGFDNMEARKNAFNSWNALNNKEIFIDGRMRANLYEVYVVLPGREKEYEKTLFDDSEVDDGECTFKSTAYVGMMIGARITQVMVNYLTNKASKEEICSIPFKIQEFTEPFLINIEDYENIE